jgi:hypothetical protein
MGTTAIGLCAFFAGFVGFTFRSLVFDPVCGFYIGAENSQFPAAWDIGSKTNWSLSPCPL